MQNSLSLILSSNLIFESFVSDKYLAVEIALNELLE